MPKNNISYGIYNVPIYTKMMFNSNIVPLKEPPILIEYSHRVDEYSYGLSNSTANERKPLTQKEVWLDTDIIPSIPPPKGALPGGGPIVGVAQGFLNVPLTRDITNPLRFTSNDFFDMIPANYSGGDYTPTLHYANGDPIAFAPTEYVCDGVRKLVEFKYTAPDVATLYIDYWRYVGTFPSNGGGSGTITGGLNMAGRGAGAGVYKDTVVPNLRFRTLVGGNGVTITENTDTVSIVGSDIPPVANMQLHVSAAGNDISGDGTSGTPYATLERAFTDVRNIGYDDTCTIFVMSEGGPLSISGTMSFEQGSKGKRKTQVVIMGNATFSLNEVYFISARGYDLYSGLLTVTASTAYSSSPLGKMVLFIDGPLTSYTGNPIFPGQPVRAWVVKVNGQQLTLAFSDGLPNVGNNFVIEEPVARIVITSTTRIHGDGQGITFRNLFIENTTSGSGATLDHCRFTFNRVRFNAMGSAGFSWYGSFTSQLFFGRYMGGRKTDNYDSYINCGSYFSTNNGGIPTVYIQDAEIDIAYSGFQGHPTVGNINIIGQVTEIRISYFNNVSCVHSYDARNIAIYKVAAENCLPSIKPSCFFFAQCVLESINSLVINGSTDGGITFVNSYIFTNAGLITVSACSGNAVTLENSYWDVNNTLDVSGNFSTSLLLTKGSVMDYQDNILISVGNTTGTGMTITDQSIFRTDNTVTIRNDGAGMLVQNNSFIKASSLDIADQAVIGLTMNSSNGRCSTMIITDTGSSCIYMLESHIDVIDSVTARRSAGSMGIYLYKSSINCTTIDSQEHRVSAIVAGDSDVYAINAIFSTSAISSNILLDASRIVIGAQLISDNAAQHFAIEMYGKSEIINSNGGTCSLTNNAAGIYMSNSTIDFQFEMLITGCTGNNTAFPSYPYGLGSAIVMFDSKLSCYNTSRYDYAPLSPTNGEVTLSSNNGDGIIMMNSTIKFNRLYYDSNSGHMITPIDPTRHVNEFLVEGILEVTNCSGDNLITAGYGFYMKVGSFTAVTNNVFDTGGAGKIISAYNAVLEFNSIDISGSDGDTNINGKSVIQLSSSTFRVNGKLNITGPLYCDVYIETDHASEMYFDSLYADSGGYNSTILNFSRSKMYCGDFNTRNTGTDIGRFDKCDIEFDILDMATHNNSDMITCYNATNIHIQTCRVATTGTGDYVFRITTGSNITINSAAVTRSIGSFIELRHNSKLSFIADTGTAIVTVQGGGVQSDYSNVYIDGVTINATDNASAVRMVGGQLQCNQSTLNSTNGTCLELSSGCNANLSYVGGVSTASAFGCNLTKGSNLRFLSTSVTLQGTSDECYVGALGSVSWATIQANNTSNLNDYDYSRGSSTEMVTVYAY